ncbi:hypothetical protein MTR67_034765 [Solanum verrucosum]|uniref:Uncharacterized protein n=1 Tax=Solanum verrucosum TaxID=315347 RepID=A0AAF0U8M1_SOLVR|nr:hypothetical protein MTR67_034765 [Solanum verrucosum]
MPKYRRERLNSWFSITIHRTQYSELKNFNDTTHLKKVQLIGFMWNYGHKYLNSRTSWVICNNLMEINTKDLELEDTTSLKDAQFTMFVHILWTWTTRHEGLHNNMELVHMTLLILILTSLKLSSNQ